MVVAARGGGGRGSPGTPFRSPTAMGAGRPLREHHGAADATIRLSLRPDGQEGPEFDGISDGTLGLSPDGGRAIYVSQGGVHAL